MSHAVVKHYFGITFVSFTSALSVLDLDKCVHFQGIALSELPASLIQLNLSFNMSHFSPSSERKKS